MAAGKQSIQFDFDNRLALIAMGRAISKLHNNADNILVEHAPELKENIIKRIPRDTGLLASKVFSAVQVKRRGGPVLEAGVAGVPYAVFVEFGTSDTPAQPFLRPAIAESEVRLRQKVR